jgi:branched-chain amino acid transport system substrate-binding protein
LTSSRPWFRRTAALVTITAVSFSACTPDDGGASSASGGSAAPVRGFDGTTIKVAALGVKSQLPGTEWGAKARLHRFNDTAELTGVKIDYLEYVDDKQDTATALSETRRLVDDAKVFALVGMTSPVVAGDYLAQQKVPYFGAAFSSVFCSREPSTEVWGFSYTGCQIPEEPVFMPDSSASTYHYISTLTGKARPTTALFSGDVQSGRFAMTYQTITQEGAGFEVVSAEAMIPPPPVSDYTPYVQKLMTSDNGHAPDLISCLLATDCIPIYAQLQAAGFKGVYRHNLLSDLLAKSMEGSIVSSTYANVDDDNAFVTQMRTDVKAVKADQALETGSVNGYVGADMFIQALKAAAKDGPTGITPENVRKAASTMTWEAKGFAGPTRYPDASAGSTPSCVAVLKSDGQAWKTVEPFACSDKRYPVKN